MPQRDYYDEAPEAPDKTAALLPKSVLGGRSTEVGDTITLRVTGIHEDGVTVAYTSPASEPGEPDTPDTETMEDADEAVPAAPDDLYR